MKNIIFTIILLVFNIQLFSQVQIWAAKDYSKASIDSVHTTGSGISGPGKAVVGNGFGGHSDNFDFSVMVTEQKFICNRLRHHQQVNPTH